MAHEPNDETQFLRGYIEPDAVDLRLDHDGQIRLSQAISLKRIADGIDRLAMPLAEQIVTALREPINSYGEGIGEAIQGQMIRGQRGIDQYER